MWIKHADFEKWEVWVGSDWPTDDGVPDRFEGTLTRHPVDYFGPDGVKKKAWRYVPFRGKGFAPKVSRDVVDHRKLASGERDT